MPTHTLRYGDGPQAIYDSLKSRIVSGELPAGQELRILNVAKEYNISTVTVREAVRMLASDKLMELRPRRSPIVVLPDLSEILEMNEIRIALEPLALKAAIPRHNEKTIAACRRLIDNDMKEKHQWRKVELNRQFHLALLSPSNKPRLLHTIEEQYEGISRLAQYLVIGKSPVVESPHNEHMELFEAVAARKSRQAVKLLVEHIRASTERVVALIDAKET